MTVDGRVGRLALRATSRTAVDDFARQIEVALALARWPYVRPGEVILIRRLALDDLPHGASVHLLADLIGRRLVEIRPVRLRAGDTEQPEAAAVAFAGRLEALAALVTQLARHGSGRAWYWRRLVPPPAPSKLADIALQVLVEARAPPRGTAGAAAFAQLLLETDVLDAFIAGLPTSAVAGFEEVRGAEPPPLRPASPAASPDQRITGPVEDELPGEAQVETWWQALPGAWRAALARQARRLPEDDPRLLWLAVTALVAGFGPAAGAPAATLAWRLVGLARGDGVRIPPPDRPPALTQVPAAGPLGRPPGQAGMRGQRAPPPAPEDRAPSSGLEPVPAAGPFSSWAGLWLLPAALAQLRIADVQSPYGPGLGVACMRALAARLGVADDDRAVAALPQAAPDLPGAAPFLAPPAWRVLAAPHPRAAPAFALCRAGRYRLLTDRAGRLPLALTLDRRELRRLTLGDPVRRRPDMVAPESGLALLAVRLALARYLRRVAGLSLRRLVCRPGTVIATATHVDVIFPGEVIELRLRRAGLDFDPGWVPWLGRVVTYHYDLERGWRG